MVSRTSSSLGLLSSPVSLFLPAETMPRSMERTPESRYNAAASACAGYCSWGMCGRKARASRKTPWPPTGSTMGTPASISFCPRYRTCPTRARMWSSCRDSSMPVARALHVATGHAAIGMQPFVNDCEVGSVFVEVVVIHRQKAADVDQRILLGAHGAAVRVGAEFLDDGGDGAVLATGLAVLDEVCVLHHARGVQNHANSTLVGQFADRLHVGQRNRLATGQVYRGGDADVGNARGAIGLDDLLQFVQVHIALESA